MSKTFRPAHSRTVGAGILSRRLVANRRATTSFDYFRRAGRAPLRGGRSSPPLKWKVALLYKKSLDGGALFAQGRYR
jgi:hypothetical protein